jgi:hypothetical protein
VKGVLFEMPPLWALLDRPPYESSRNFDAWALSFDDIASTECEESVKGFFLPLVQSEEASGERNLTILGMILQEIRNDKEERTFSRVGLAVVDETDGCVANSGWFLKRWTSPPWTDDCRLNVSII